MKRGYGLLQLPAMVSLLALGGCYSFTGASVPANLKTIAIPLVDDQSGFGQPGLREEFTTTLTNLFINDNSLEVADRTVADAILEGVITSVTDAPAVIQGAASGQQAEQVSKRRITITARYTMRDMKLHRKMWEKSFSEWGDYDTGGGGASQRETGIQAALQKVTDDILQETVSGW